MAVSDAVPPARVSPIYGWGFVEALDGELALPFNVAVEEAGVDVGHGVRGWRGAVATASHKYAGMSVHMSPRHVDWDGVVNLRVHDRDNLVFSGMADTMGLECYWN